MTQDITPYTNVGTLYSTLFYKIPDSTYVVIPWIQNRFMVFTSTHPADVCGQFSIRDTGFTRRPHNPTPSLTDQPVRRISEHLAPRWQVIYHLDRQGIVFELSRNN